MMDDDLFSDFLAAVKWLIDLNAEFEGEEDAIISL